MKNLSRALRMTLNYRWSLITSFICSVMVALLWSLNLGAVYPFVEIVLKGNSLHDWLRVEEVESDKLIIEKTAAIRDLENQLLDAKDDKQLAVIENKIQGHEPEHYCRSKDPPARNL